MGNARERAVAAREDLRRQRDSASTGSDPVGLMGFLRKHLDVQEAKGDAIAFPPPGYKPDPDLLERGTWLIADAGAKRQLLDEFSHYSPGDGGYAEMWLAVRLAALPFDREPGYKPEWRP